MSPYFVIVAIFLSVFMKTEARSVRSTAIRHIDGGFALDDLEPNKYFSVGVVPKKLNEEMSISFFDVYLPFGDCDVTSVEIQEDGYIKSDFHRVGLFCDEQSLSEFTAKSQRGFHVIVRTGPGGQVSGSLKMKFEAPSGNRVTNEVLYG